MEELESNELKTRKIVLGAVLALVALPVSQTLAELLASLLIELRVSVFVCNICAGILYIIFAFLLLKLLAEKFLKRTLGDFAIPKFGIKAKWAVVAVALPAAVTGVFLLLRGEGQSGGMDAAKALGTICAGVFFAGLGAGFVEEMVFRGLVMNLLLRKWGKKIAVIAPSVLFALVHLIGRNFTLLSCLQVLVAGTAVGIMFSLIALEGDSVWNSAIVHAVWNAAIIGGIFSVGKGANADAIYSYVLQTENFALTGGEFGIESSVIAIAAYALVAVFAFLNMQHSRKL